MVTPVRRDYSSAITSDAFPRCGDVITITTVATTQMKTIAVSRLLNINLGGMDGSEDN